MAQSIHVATKGPLFTGVAQADLEAAIDAVKRAVAEEAERKWQANMTASFKHPSSPPHYQSKINITRREADLVVSDGYPGSGVLYGPWLEGVGSRNATTRFKGYFSMRKAANSIAQKASSVAKPIIDRFITKANGV